MGQVFGAANSPLAAQNARQGKNGHSGSQPGKPPGAPKLAIKAEQTIHPVNEVDGGTIA